MSFNLNSLRLIDFLEAAMFIFLTAGIKGNQLAIALDRVFMALTGFSVLPYAKIPPATTETALTPAQIAKAIGMSGRKKTAKLINSMLEEAQFQIWLKGKGNWTPTEKGKKYAVLIDTGKRYPDGSPILQLKWKPDIVAIVRDLIPF